MQKLPAWIVALDTETSFVVEALEEKDVPFNAKRTLRIEYDPSPSYISPEERARLEVKLRRGYLSPRLFMQEGVTIDGIVQNPEFAEKGWKDIPFVRKCLELEIKRYRNSSNDEREKAIKKYDQTQQLSDEILFAQYLPKMKSLYGLMEELNPRYPHIIEVIPNLRQGAFLIGLPDNGFYLATKKHESLQKAVDALDSGWRKIRLNQADKTLEREVILEMLS